VVAANLSAQVEHWDDASFSGEWEVLMNNYPDSPAVPGKVTLRPFEAVYWLQK